MSVLHSLTVYPSQPTSQASSVSFSSVTVNSMTVNWANGNGTKRIVLMKEGSSVNSSPADYQTYTASSVFGSGSQIGSGNYVVYNGTGTSVNVTGLKSNTTYYAAVFESNGGNYLTTSPAAGSRITGKPSVSFTTSSQSRAENGGAMNVTAQLSVVSGLNVTVPFTLSGTASNGADYSITGSPVTITAGSTTKNITIIPVNDTLYESSETVIITMGTPVNATASGTTVHTAAITNYDLMAYNDYSNNTSDNISDLTTIYSSISVTDIFDIADVNVEINITHTNDANLDIYLIHPDGTEIELSTANGGTGGNYTNTIFDSDSTDSITAGTAPFTGTYSPEGSLNSLNGKPASGDWQLKIYDNAAGDTGTLVNWSLYIGASMTPPGNALDFDGVDDYVDCGNDTSLNITQKITIEAWFKGTSNANWNGIVAKMEGFNIQNYLLQMTPDGFIQWTYSHSSNTNDYLEGTVSYDDNIWHHAAGVIDTTTGVSRLYIDGVLAAEKTGIALEPMTTTTSPMTIGTRTDINNEFPGKIDEVRIWNTARTQAEIQAGMNKILTGTETGLAAYYRFDQDNSGILMDITSNNNDGTLINMEPAADWVPAGWNYGYPYVITDNVSSITADSAFVNGSVVDGGLSAVTESGICWNTTGNPSIIDNTVPFGTVLTGLTPGQTCYVRAYASNPFGNAYGNQDIFAPEMTLPGNALEFDGVDDYVTIPHNAGLALTDNFTLEVWFKAGTLGERLIDKGGVGTNEGFTFDTYNAKLRFINKGTDIGESTSIDGATTLQAGQWYHAAVVFSTASGVTIYNNGVIDANATPSIAGVDYGYPLNIGSVGQSPGSFFDGQIDEVRIWNTARTQAEIQASMNKRLSGDEPGLTAYYTFDHISGNSLADLTANNNHGILMAGPVWITPLHITSVTSAAADGAYNAGKSIDIEIQFNDIVNLDTTGGTPDLDLNTGEKAEYVSGSGTNTLIFNYTVVSGNISDLDYSSINAFNLNSGTIDARIVLPEPGQPGSFGASKNIIIDTNKPAEPSTPDLIPETDTGISPSDNLTNNTAPSFTGTAEPGSTVELFRNGTILSGTNLAAADGTWTITSAEISPDNSYLITAKAVDPAENISIPSAALLITIDTLKPELPIDKSATPVNTLKPTWEWASGGDAGDGNLTTGIFRYRLDNSDMSTGTQEINSTSLTWETNLSEGIHILYVQEKDRAGNWSDAAALTVVIDTTLPAMPNVSSTDITNNVNPLWTWTPGGTGNSIFKYSFNTAITSGAVGPTSDTQYTHASDLEDGSYTLYVQEQDDAGNWSATASFTVIVDTIPPAAPSLSGSTPTNNPQPLWTWISGGDNLDGNGTTGTFRYRLDNSTGTTLTSAFEYKPDSILTGFHTLYVQEEDYAGNWSDAGSYTIEYDPNLANPPVVSSEKNLTNNQKPLWTWISGGGTGTFRYKLNNNDLTGAPEIQDTSFSPETALAEGPNTLFVQEKNLSGNWSSSGSFTIIIDITKPSPPQISGVSLTNNPDPGWTWISGGDGGDNNGVSGLFRFQLDNSDLGSLEGSSTTVFNTSGLADGVHTLYIQEQDNAGNWSDTASSAVTIDTKNPAPPVVTGTTPTNDTSPEWSWISGGDSGDGNGTSGKYRFQVDNSDLSSVSAVSALSFIPPSNLTDGEHILYIQEQDNAANWSDITEYSIFVDHTLTSPPIVSSEKELTNISSPTWTWISGGDGNGTFRFRLDPIDETSSESTKNTSFTAQDLPDGIYTLYVEEEVEAGNWSPPGYFQITIDTIPPATGTITVLDDQGLTKNAFPGILIQSMDADYMRLALNQTELYSKQWIPYKKEYADADTAYNEFDLSAGGDGDKLIFVQFKDEAGNEQPVLAITRTIYDTTPPELPVIYGEKLSNTAFPVWRWEGGGGGSGIFSYKLDEGTVKTGTERSYTPAQELLQGLHTLYVQEKDYAGNWSEASSFAIQVDTETPSQDSIEISGVPAETISSSSLTITLSSADIVLYKYKIDNSAAWSSEQPVSAPVNLTGLADGDHILYIIGRDAAGNWQEESSAKTVSWTIDTTPPEITGISDTIVPVKNISWTWTSSEPALYCFAVDQNPEWIPAGTFASTASAEQSSGTGTYYLHVQAKDAVGNTSAVKTVSVILDNTAPVPAIAPPVNDTIAAQGKTWNWSASDEDSDITYRYIIDQNSGGTPSGEYSKITGASKNDGTGTYFIHVQAKDRAGNESIVVSASAVLDNSPPVITGIFDVSSPVQGKTWNWSSDEPGIIFRYSFDQNPAGMPSGVYENIETAEISKTSVENAGLTYKDGIWYLHVQAQDQAGNQSQVKTVYVFLDNTPPVIKGLADDNNVSQGKVWYWTTDEPALYRYLIDQNPEGAPLPDSFYSSINTAEKTSADGIWYIHIQAKDTAGNESSIASVYAVLDNTSEIKGLFDDPVPAQTKTWNWDSDEPGTLFRFSIDQNPAGTISGDYQDVKTAEMSKTSIENTGLIYNDGIWYIHVQAKDLTGNQSQVKTVYALLDNTSPQITGITDDSMPAQSKTWFWSASDINGYIEFRYKIDQDEAGIPLDEFSNIISAGITTESQGYADGTWYLHLQARDKAGNMSSVKTVYAVLDNTAPDKPKIIAGTKITNDTTPTWTWDSGGGIRVFRYQLNDSSMTETNETSYTPITPLEQGIYTLYVQEKDYAGNWSEASSFAIQVDTETPSQDSIEISGVPAETISSSSLTITLSSADIVLYKYKIDNSAAWSSEQPVSAPVNLTGLADGTHILYIIGRDAAGNWQEEISARTVSWTIDTTPPEITGISDTIVPVKNISWTWASSEPALYCFAVDQNPEWIPAGTFDSTVSAGQSSGTGTYYLHVQAKDAVGNTSAVKTVSAILDNTAPVLAIDPPVNDTIAAQSKTWNWSADEQGVIFRYSIDQNPAGIPGGEYYLVTKAEKSEVSGTWYIHVQAKDRAGNESQVKTGSVVLDNLPPVITGLFNITTPVKSIAWSWKGDTDAEFIYSIDQDSSGIPSGDFSSVTSAEKTGGNGIWYLHVQAKDPLGNISNITTVHAVLDNTPPASPKVSGVLLTNSSNPSWSWAPGSSDGIEEYQYELKDNKDFSLNGITSGRSFISADTLADGSYTLYVKQRDFAGNWSEPGTFTTIVDKTASSPPEIVEGQTLINTKTYTVSWTSGGGTGKYRYCADGGAWSTETQSTQANISVHEKTNSFCVEELDNAGNWSASACVEITADFGKPCSKASAPATVNTSDIILTYEAEDRFEDSDCLLKPAPFENTGGTGLNKIELYMKKEADTEFILVSTDEQSIDGEFKISLKDKGIYLFKTIAYDKAGNIESKTEKDAQTLYTDENSGYAILSVGSVADQEGLKSHTKTAVSVYQHLINRGFLVHEYENHWSDSLDHIKFFTPYNEEPVAGRDDYSLAPENSTSLSYWDAMKYAVTEWAPQRMSKTRGPLYLILIDHGTRDRFYLNGFSYISGSQLDSWLDILEQKLGTDYDYTKNPIVVIIGTCYSGSFKDDLEGPSRIIITSTAADEVSYRGPMTPGLYRDGEFFITALFNELGKGRNIQTGFNKAEELTKIHTDSGTNEINQEYFDTARQHPQIEHYFSDEVFESIVLGRGTERSVEISQAGYEISSDTLWAKTSNPGGEAEIKVWVEIRNPGYELEASEETQVTSLFVNLAHAELHWNNEKTRYESTGDNMLEQIGRYSLFFYAMNDTTGIISHPLRIIAYHTPCDVNGDGNLTLDDSMLALKILSGQEIVSYEIHKEADINGDGRIGMEEVVWIQQKLAEVQTRAFNLISPPQGGEVGRIMVMDWEDAYSGGINLTYTVLTSFDNQVFTVSAEDLRYSSYAKEWTLDQDTKIFWKVRAVDEYGIWYETPARSFTVIHTNSGENSVYVELVDSGSNQPVSDAFITFNGKSLEQCQNNICSGSFSPGVYNVAIQSSGYINKLFSNVIVPNPVEGSLNARYYLCPGNLAVSGNLDCFQNADLSDAVLALQISSGIMPQVPALFPENSVSKTRIGIEDAVYIMQKIAGLR
ncbi:Uncharacterized protein dnl_39760 [Desulfonema limicola]|uniref:P/Homo B domain-containing protein n=2 Tax=Desulfonema limicola TaxID=45656 RepID=A0A975B9U8_9BACT|nr:Uncharacterized protein dnl_39760 [Desulfonema limicola]